MRTIKNILTVIVLLFVMSSTITVSAQENYKANADTARYTAGFYMLSKTIGNTVYYTYNLSHYTNEFENLYFKDIVVKFYGDKLKVISYKNSQEAIFAIDKLYADYNLLRFFANANKTTLTENRNSSETQKQSFVSKIKESKTE